MTKIRWGICSTGNIATKFASDIRFVENTEIVAVGSRRKEDAERFGQTFNIPHRHGSYAALAADPDVDVVYIGTPHAMHHENTLLFLNAGKSVLCEKPFAINAKQAQEMIDAARKNNVFLMEAHWTYFLPGLKEVQRMVREGLIGKVRMLDAAFSYYKDYDPKDLAFNPDLGGGGLLDVGVYPLALAQMILGFPLETKSFYIPEANGVDGVNALLCRFENGALGHLTSGVHLRRPVEALITGEKGWIKLTEPFYKGESLTVRIGENDPKSYRFALKGGGYGYEAEEVVRCLQEGKKESSVVPLSFTLKMMQLLDSIRAEWGLKYPME